MKIAFRVDASYQIGSGHIMRCLALAHELRDRGAQLLFISRKLPGHLCNRVVSQGFDVHLLKEEKSKIYKGISKYDETEGNNVRTFYDKWLSVDQNVDKWQTLKVLEKNAPWDWIVVDHYALKAGWESSMLSVVKKILCIDDLANRNHECNILLDQNYFQEPEKRYANLISNTCIPIYGPKFALMRSDFRKAKTFARLRGNGIARILIYFGGYDHDNLSGMCLEAFDCSELRHLLVDVVVGDPSPHFAQIEKQAAKRPGTRILIQPDSFIELLLRADLCIGAGGTSTWERLCLNLPSIVITVEKNQEPLIKELSCLGIVTWLGNKSDVNVKNIRSEIVKSVQNFRSKILQKLPYLIDGYGALRVAELMIPSEEKDLSLRKVQLSDADIYFYWSNEPESRNNSFHQNTIKWDDHLSWFNHKVRSKNTLMWVLVNQQDLALGQIRFDIGEDGIGMISYGLDVLVRGKKMGKILLELGLRKAQKAGVNNFQAKVKIGNIASRRLFKKLKFHETIVDDVCIYKCSIMENNRL